MFSTNDPDRFAELIHLGSTISNPKLTLSGDLPSNLDEFILSGFWPQEVDSSAIVTTEEGITRRARAIITSCRLLKGQKFLDVGCGKGHCIIEASKREMTARGFDIKADWDDTPENKILTTDFDIIKQEGPYDIVTLYDVIDHIVDPEECVELLRDVRKVCAPDAKVHVRCHPWTSRHGGHLYLTINKAFAHILLSDEALEKIECEAVRKITRPIHEYKALFAEAGFTINSKSNVTRPLEKLFETDPVVKIFQEKLDAGKEWQKQVLPIEFVDYVLTC